ncbi:TPA: Holliday junction branch migration protein RuvA [bacterium]|nr:Holliday junction branch migration protein RuvA [bacterium]
MIEAVKGRLVLKNPTHCIIDVGGVGYGLDISLSTFHLLPNEKEVVSLSCYTTFVKEKIQLFGFFHKKEKEIFLTLISISGIGPKIALRILSEVEPDKLDEIIKNHDVSGLSKIKGVGEKIARRIILELSNKLVVAEKDEMGDSVISALISLGYTQKEAKKAVTKIKERPKSLEEFIKEALKAV